MAQLMPMPLTVSCFSKIQIGFTFLVPTHLGGPGKGPLNGRVCVCVCVRCFADINVSQGSVATYARCSGMFNIHLTANLLGNLPVKKFGKSVNIRQNYGHESVAQVFGPPSNSPVLGSTCSGGMPVCAGGGCPTRSLLYMYRPRLGCAPNNLPCHSTSHSIHV